MPIHDLSERATDNKHMDSHEWHFRLDGDEFDIKGITELFTSEVKFNIDDQGKTHLIMELPWTTDQSQQANNSAEELVAKLNAIAQIVHGNHENLRIVGIGCKDPSGAPMHLFIHLGSSIRSRSRMGGNLTITNSGAQTEIASPPQRIGDQFLSAADADEHLERALYLFGSLPLDWRGLYMVLETAKDAHGDWKGLIAKKWVRDGLIEDFKATANSYKALRLSARHGSVKTGIDKPRLTLAEARDMVRTILEKWVKSQA